MNTQITYLADHPTFIPTLAQWHHTQWAYLSIGDSVEKRIAMLQTHLGRKQIPTTFVALCDSALIGSASLIAHDMDTHMHLSPWLASVYVTPEHRRQGVGAALVQHVIEEARALGQETLYLYTPDQEAFYARRGWTRIESVQYRGYSVVVMNFRIGS